MLTIENSTFINRPQQEVFDFISNPANNPKWQGTTEAAEWISEGPVRAGSTWRQIDKFMGRKLEGMIEVTVWDPPNQFNFRAVSGPAKGNERTLRFESQENGTRLTDTFRGEIGGIFKLMAGLVRRQAEKVGKDDHERLKRLLEAGQA